MTSQRWRGWHHNGGQWLHTIRGWVFTCHDAWWFLNVVVFFGGSPWFFCLMCVCLFVCLFLLKVFVAFFLFGCFFSWTLLDVFLAGMLGMLAGWVWCVLQCFVDYFVWVCVCSDAGSCRQNKRPRFLTHMAASFNSDRTGSGSKLDNSCYDQLAKALQDVSFVNIDTSKFTLLHLWTKASCRILPFFNIHASCI